MFLLKGMPLVAAILQCLPLESLLDNSGFQ